MTKEKELKEIVDKNQGFYLIGETLGIHFSPIPNWYSMMKNYIIKCPVCKKYDFKINYPKDFNLNISIEENNILYSHRMVKLICPKCNTKIKMENYD